MNVGLLKQDLASLRVDVDNQLDVLRRRARESGCSIFEIQTPDGHSPLINLLAAKATVLLALTNLETSK
jgi:hypothetical protein